MTEEKVAEVPAENNGQVKKENDNAEEKTDLDIAIIRQVEYYFGDLNLPRDKFLREQVKLDEGWVPLDILIKFNRLAQLTTDLAVIASALNKSTTGLLEVSEDNKKVRRSPEMPLPEMNEERRKELVGRTIYAKGFPKDLALDDLLKFFKQYDEVENIIMRKYQEIKTKTRHFKGSVFATFKTKEQAEKFMETKDLKYGDNELIIKWQDAYLTEKQEEYAAKKEKRDKKPKKEDTEKPKDDIQLPTGTVLHFTQSNEKFKREDIKEGLEKLECEIAYVDFNVGDSQGWVRLSKENAAKEAIEKITDGKLTIGETEVTIKLLEGDEEKAYLDKTIEEISKRRKNQKNNRHNRQGKNNYKGKHQHGKKRKQGNHDEAPSTKIKAEAPSTKIKSES